MARLIDGSAEKNVGILKNLIQQQGGKAQNQSNPKNMLMQLRKCVLGSFLLFGALS